MHQRDAWEALGALLPPKQRRGLVLIDPPFEDPHEFAIWRLALPPVICDSEPECSSPGIRSSTGRPSRMFLTRLQEGGIRDIVAAELCLREPVDPGRLNGCGMLVVNPPYRFEQEAQPILTALLDRLGDREAGGNATIRRIADE